jgi:hypothetical protein
MSNTTTTATVAEIFAAALAADHARDQANIDQETNPVYKANRIASLANSKAWLAAHSQNKYVGSGSAHEDGINIDFTKHFATEAEAAAEVARFPKFVKVKQGKQYLGGGPGSVPFVTIRISLHSGKVTGAANETGVKRIKRFLQIAGEYVWHNQYSKNHLTNEAFQASF